MLVVCAGTATDIGKTWVGATVLGRVRARGVSVSARKPAQSFAPGPGSGPTDATVLAAATGEDEESVCPPHRSYPIAMAPPMAASVLGLPAPRLAELVSELRWPSPPPSIRWVESVGGVRSPIADDGDTVSLCHALHPDLVVLVADAGLGTINAVLTSVAPLSDHRVVVLLNRYDAGDDLHRRNLDWLEARCGMDILIDVDDLAARLTQG
jgi:dethiobiotin synthetase